MKNSAKILILFSSLLIIFLLSALFLKRSQRQQANKIPSDYHTWSDDSTMLVKTGMLFMPYNRFIDPQGTVVRYGNAKSENHSLDCTLFPGGKILAVEDRFGLAFIEVSDKKVLCRLEFDKSEETKGYVSVYSGIKAIEINGNLHVFWSACNRDSKNSAVFDGIWDGEKLQIKNKLDFPSSSPQQLALPNDLAIRKEGSEYFIYVVLNGTNQLCKINLANRKKVWSVSTGMAPYGIAIARGKAFVSNWAGSAPLNNGKETAGIPDDYGPAYINHKTGGVSSGTVAVVDLNKGKLIKEIAVGLHPNSIVTCKEQTLVYVANGNSDNISVINTGTDELVDSISTKLNKDSNPYFGDSPDGLVLNPDGSRLYVSNGMDNAVAVIKLGKKSSKYEGEDSLLGFIPTEAYPSGLATDEQNLYICNLEGEGSRVAVGDSFTAHREGATVSIINVPGDNELGQLTHRVEEANLFFRTRLAQLMPRPDVAARPVPERIGEPSLIKHALYIIKENRTYDQVLGDVTSGNGRKDLCIYGDSITPNQHQLAKDFVLLDNYYASGKSSAEGHQWTDAAMVSDYIEKNVRAWFRSYPHVQNDALVYNKEGFIWNNALDHGKSVRIYGEACEPEAWDRKLKWQDIYNSYKQGHPVHFENHTTISRIRPILSASCPCADTHEFSDVERADAFIAELQQFESKEGDSLPQLMIMALSDDHTAGTREGIPTPRAMVADNDMAVGKIVEALSHSRFWSTTAIFITEDDAQDGWDHVSGYRTTGFIISPFSGLRKTVHTDYNQTCMVRTIEQILGLPPMNVIDATALPMFDCFGNGDEAGTTRFTAIPNKIPLDELNKKTASLTGTALQYALLSATPQFDHVDKGDDELLNHILWFTAKGNLPYPKSNEKHLEKDDD